jgi:sugar/nucleoside kinase (ribokinase family)
MVNTAPGVPGAELLVPVADVLVVNAGEAMGLSGASGDAAAEALVGRGAGSVVVTLGAAGAYLLTGGTPTDSRHPRSPRSTRPGPATCSPVCWRRHSTLGSIFARRPLGRSAPRA